MESCNGHQDYNGLYGVAELSASSAVSRWSRELTKELSAFFGRFSLGFVVCIGWGLGFPSPCFAQRIGQDHFDLSIHASKFVFGPMAKGVHHLGAESKQERIAL